MVLGGEWELDILTGVARATGKKMHEGVQFNSCPESSEGKKVEE
jgi:hypothetical protein